MENETTVADQKTSKVNASDEVESDSSLLTSLFQAQRAAYHANPYPSAADRITKLKSLQSAIKKHQQVLVEAISKDFGCRSLDESLLADVMPTLMNIRHNIKHLREWMKPQSRGVGILFQPASAKMVYQPLGVIGIMSPWNYPVFLSLGPLVAAIAAGNRAMIKPSEYCPETNTILKLIVSEVFENNEVCIVEGDASVATAFSELPFDHIIFTGSTSVGKLVMSAASKNLTPVTLELGGKSPAIIGPDVSADFAAERMLYGKCLNAGQTCVAPDYVLIPEAKVDDFIESVKSRFSSMYPQVGNGDYTSVVNDIQYHRLQSWLKDATDKGANVISLTAPSNNPRSMPLQLLTNVDPDMQVMQDEIFGPILPIVPYRSIDDALEKIYRLPRPLALYLFTFDKNLQDRILRETHAGGVCINDTMSHTAQEDLPFGGIGKSGMGAYHAKEGFLTFSHAKPVFRRGRLNSMKLVFPPYGRWIHRLIYRWFM